MSMGYKSQVKTLLLITCNLLLVAIITGCQNQKLYRDNRLMMGTFVEVTSGDPRAAGIVFTQIRQIEGLLSKYDPGSEISKLNKTGFLKASRDTFYIIKRSKEFWRESNGAFDITVAPLVDLWGFTEKKYRVPGDKEIKDALKLVGSDKIILNEADNVIKFELSGMKIDLGGIAKGFAVDCAVKKLKESGIKSCLINAGGQIYCLGGKLGNPWKVAVRNPRGKGFIDYLELKDRAVSTSGDDQQYFLSGGRRYPHIINPRTGYPADSGVISVTITADDGLTTDALSTAIFVLGKEKGKVLVKKNPAVKIEAIE